MFPDCSIPQWLEAARNSATVTTRVELGPFPIALEFRVFVAAARTLAFLFRIEHSSRAAQYGASHESTRQFPQRAEFARFPKSVGLAPMPATLST